VTGREHGPSEDVDVKIALMTGWRPRWNPALDSYAKPIPAGPPSPKGQA
jgi:hypothetical protein